MILCRLGHFYAPEILPLRKIYDRDQAKYHVREIVFVSVNSVHQHSHLDTIQHTSPLHAYMGGTHFYTSIYLLHMLPACSCSCAFTASPAMLGMFTTIVCPIPFRLKGYTSSTQTTSTGGYGHWSMLAYQRCSVHIYLLYLIM